MKGCADLRPGEREAFVGLGSNLGDRAAHLEAALAGLRATRGVRVLAVSRWIETAPVGGPPGQGDFLNGAARLAVRLGPEALLCRLQALEAAAGRVRGVPNGPRTLDLDLWLVGDLERAGPELTLPHARFEERLFALEPLAELAPGLRLPRSGECVAERARRLRVAAPAGRGT